MSRSIAFLGQIVICFISAKLGRILQSWTKEYLFDQKTRANYLFRLLYGVPITSKRNFQLRLSRPEENFERLKADILNLMLKVLFFFTIPLVVFSWSRYFTSGFQPVMLVHATLFIVLSWTFAFRNKYQTSTKSHVLVSIFLVIGLAGVTARSLVIYAFPCSIMAVTLASLLLDRKKALFYLAIEGAVITIMLLAIRHELNLMQSIFEILAYGIFQYFLIEVLSKIQLAHYDANRLLSSSLEAKTKFLAMMSHELRTPLNGILLATDELKSIDMSKEGSEIVDVIDHSTKNFNNILNDILDYSKMEKNKLSLYNQPFELKGFLEQISKTYRKLAESKSLKFNASFEFSEGLSVETDAMRLEQVLRNLLGNAIKFTNEGEIHFSATIENELLKVTIKDSGIGIHPDKLEKIFKEFEQEETATASKYGGTGLGLAIVKRLMNLLEGEIKIDSVKGTGTRFELFFTFPMFFNTKKTDNISEHLNLGLIPKDLSVLIVEDNQLNSTLLKKLLLKWGIQNISVCKNGAEAIETLKTSSLDLVLMDVNMPVMGGVEATRKIRAGEAGEKNLGVQIIGLSANSFDEDIQKAMESGMNQYTSKPINKKELFEIIIDKNQKKILKSS